mgnify:FL=1
MKEVVGCMEATAMSTDLGLSKATDTQGNVHIFVRAADAIRSWNGFARTVRGPCIRMVPDFRKYVNQYNIISLGTVRV